MPSPGWDIPWKRFFNITATFPIIAPPFMMALAVILLFGKQGFVSSMILNNMIRFEIYGFNGLLAVETLTYFSTAYLTLYGVLQSIDPALEDAALDLGRLKMGVFRRITLPLLYRALPAPSSSSSTSPWRTSASPTTWPATTPPWPPRPI